MKTIAILAMIMAISAAATVHAASRPTSHQPGGPIKQGNYCWVYTSATGAGWWDRCDTSRDPRPVSLKGRSQTEIDAIISGGGDGGGTGGGNR